MRILTISNASAQESEVFLAVEKVLKSRGHDTSVFKQDKCLDGEYLTLEIVDNVPVYYVTIDGQQLDIDIFDAIWYMHPMLPRELILHKEVAYRQFIHNQFFAMRQGLWSLFRHKIWINDPWNVFMVENKLNQARFAHKVGFVTPDTVVTSDPNAVRAFYKKHNGNIVVKNLATSPIMDYVLATNVVTDTHMAQIESVKLTPSIFQRRIPKKHELRITVVGEKIFAVKIYSQEDEATSVDWRVKPKLNDFEVRMEETDIPQEIRNKIQQYMWLVGLRFGCIDMIVTPEDQYIFLEINPNGQWYFVQLRTGAKIAEAIADLLTTESV